MEKVAGKKVGIWFILVSLNHIEQIVKRKVIQDLCFVRSRTEKKAIAKPKCNSFFSVLVASI